MTCLIEDRNSPALRNVYAVLAQTEKQAYYSILRSHTLYSLPPSMFGRISVARRYLSSVRDNKTLRALFRYLFRVVPFPGSLAVLCVLYSIAEYEFTSLYIPLGHVWKPAFPLSWRIVFLSLFVVPTFSFLHVLWLSLHHWVLVRHWWRRRYSSRARPSQEYIRLPRGESNSPEEGDDEDCELGDIEGDAGTSGPHSPVRHQAPRRLLSSVSLRLILWSALLCTSLWLGLRYRQPGDLRYLPLIDEANAHPKRAGYANQERIFIGAMFYNNERVIPYWSDSIVKAIHYLGADNVFVSVLESGSDDQSSALLRRLDERLDVMRVSRRILTQDKAITKPDDMNSNDRIYYLSALRNRVLEPLVEKGGYDKVMFSNDIYIEPETIVELLHTAEGEYDMACGMDYGHFGLYDMWVLRDKRGQLASGIWPYFFDIEDYEAMQTESPVPVFSCWNGIVVFKADPVLPVHLRSNRTLSNDPLPFDLPATHPAANDPSLRGPSPALTPPIRFRASAPGECFSSESFLLPYDLRRLFDMQRIFSNPRVVVGYDWRFYLYFKWFMRHPVLRWWIERVYDGAWMQKAVMVVGNARQVWRWDGGDCHPWW